ncbi:MAG: transcription antitermination factor NusB [Bryobacteraceae bacterium]
MPSRHRSRQRALQVLFQADIRQQPADEAIYAFYESLITSEEPPVETNERDPFMEQLVRETMSRLGEIDHRITSHSEHWRIERMPAVDRNILRLAICEMTTTNTPPAVVIDEAIELARRFSSDESVAFVNGVLDAIHRTSASGDEITGPQEVPPEGQ